MIDAVTVIMSLFLIAGGMLVVGVFLAMYAVWRVTRG